MAKKGWAPVVGDRIGMLTITETEIRQQYSGGKRLFARAKCDCGKEILRRYASLQDPRYVSCGCFHNEQLRQMATRHGDSASRLYYTWRTMIARCHDPLRNEFKWYGKRGIAVCQEWRQSYEAFRSWALAAGYCDGLTIDRIDADQGYLPQNCRWVSRSINSARQRTNRLINAFGEEKHLSDWVRDQRCRVSYGGLRRRLDLGWAPEDAIATLPRILPSATH